MRSFAHFLRGSLISGLLVKRKMNRLSSERSPYLLQHAANPVDWYPWGSEAFEKAKKEDKLIFLSVGYSTCHWCHVMERESFENADIGALMNEKFVCIKVDREERPDVDRMYMTFVQAVAGGGGWPMSVFLTPDLKPVTGGTYFPPTDQFGRPGFPTVLRTVSDAWREQRQDVLNQGAALTEALVKLNQTSDGGDASAPPSAEHSTRLCFDYLSKKFDVQFGGFSQAPKFPQPVYLQFLLQTSDFLPNGDDRRKCLDMAERTLMFMSRGGIHDHVAQGFHRYSTDGKWHVPHFEKMLYDQAQLAVVCADAFQLTGKAEYELLLRDILTYVSRDLSHAEGGFYSAEDADSLPTADAAEKKEGAFCVWTAAEVRRLLAGSFVGAASTVCLADLFCRHYELKEDGNVSPYQDPHGELKGKNVLITFSSVEETAEHFGLSTGEVVDGLRRACDVLYAARLKRPKPHLDNKMVTAWNGLMLSGFARAAAVLDDASLAERAVKAAEFARRSLTAADGALLRSAYVTSATDNSVAHPEAPIMGFADDYAFLIGGLLDLYETTCDEQWLRWADDLQLRMNEIFWDADGSGGYFLSAKDDPSILVRMKDDQDTAEPSANSMSACNLARLGALLDCDEHRQRAARLLSTFEQHLRKSPIALPKLVCAHQFIENSATQVVIVGAREDKATIALLKAARAVFAPRKVIVFLDESAADSWLRGRVSHYKQLKQLDGRPTAFVCRDYACSQPTSSAEELTRLVSASKQQ